MKEKKKKSKPDYETDYVTVGGEGTKNETRAWLSEFNGKKSVRVAVMFQGDDGTFPTKKGITLGGSKKEILAKLKAIRTLVKEKL